MALADRGHSVEIWSDSTNQCTWFPLSKSVLYRVTKLDDAPPVDVLVAGGCRTVDPTYNFPRKQLAVNWVRAIETWVMGLLDLVKQYKLRMPLWVNSEWMLDYISNSTKRNDIAVIYPGITFEDFSRTPAECANYNYQEEVDRTRFTIGCLYSTKPRKNWKAFLNLYSKLPKSMGIRYVGFGSEPNSSILLAQYAQCPDVATKRSIYSQCHLWFAPTTNEGLHIPPMEAALCGAVVLGNDEPSAGMVDHLKYGETGYTFQTVEQACALVQKCFNNRIALTALNRRHQEVIRDKIGSVEQNAERFERQLETEFDTGKW